MQPLEVLAKIISVSSHLTTKKGSMKFGIRPRMEKKPNVNKRRGMSITDSRVWVF